MGFPIGLAHVTLDPRLHIGLDSPPHRCYAGLPLLLPVLSRVGEACVSGLLVYQRGHILQAGV